MSLLYKIADNSSKNSLSHAMRVKRFGYFMSLIGKLERPISILDIGGTQKFWNRMGLSDTDIKITLFNLFEQPVTSPNFSSEVGDATDLSRYAENSFDVVFSNSVIEHLFTKSNQQKMAAEAMRVGKFHFIQTPNYYFPIEPHFLFPGFQFLPESLRVSLTRRFQLGHMDRKENIDEARLQVEEIKLLTVKEMKQLFPHSNIWREKIAGLTKSIVAHNFI